MGLTHKHAPGRADEDADEDEQAVKGVSPNVLRIVAGEDISPALALAETSRGEAMGWGWRREALVRARAEWHIAGPLAAPATSYQCLQK